MRELERSILETVRRVAPAADECVNLDAQLTDLGLDSVHVVAMMVELEEKHRMDLLAVSDEVNFSQLRSVADLVALVAKHGSP